MKRFLKWFAVAVLVAVVVLAVVYRAVNRVPSDQLSDVERVAAIFDKLTLPDSNGD